MTTETETAIFNFDVIAAAEIHEQELVAFTLAAELAAQSELHEQELNAFTLAAELAAQSANAPVARNASVARNGNGDLWRSLQINDSAVISLTGTLPAGNAMTNPNSTKALAFKTLQDAITARNGAALRVIDIVGKRGVPRAYLAWFGQDHSVAFDGVTGAALPRKIT